MAQVMIQTQLSLIALLLGIVISPAFTNPCQVYPSGYDYRDDSVMRDEKSSAGCMKYPRSGVAISTYTEEYIHCGGTQLVLADSYTGTMQYSSSYYYAWNAESGSLLFIFPDSISLTTITLHYYSDSRRGLPRLKFYAVPDDFNVWDIATSDIQSFQTTAVDGESVGRRSVSFNVTFSTTRVLMYKYNSGIMFAVSEVEFFICIPTSSVTPNQPTTYMTTTLTNNNTANLRITATNINMKQDTDISQATTANSSLASEDTIMIAVGIAGALLFLTIFLIITLLLLLWHHKRTHKLEINPNSGSMGEDASYSTLERGMKQHTQPQTSTELYDQIHLSPSTGQTELISKTETKDISTPISNIYSSIDIENSQPISNHNETEISKSPEDVTYAIVDKKKKKKKSREASDNSKKIDSTDKEKIVTEKGKDQLTAQDQPSLEEMYAIVYKKPKKSEEQEETAPSIPAHTVESLYTAVQKKPK